MPGVGDPVLGARQDVVVAVAHGPGAHGRHVAAGIGLGQAVAGLDLAGSHPRHVRVLELLAGPVHDRDHPELGDHDGQRGGGADPSQLLDRDGLGDAVCAGAPVGLRDAERGQLHLLAGLEGLPRELGVAVGLGRVRRHLLLGEGAHGLAEVPLDVGQGEGRRAHSAILAHTAIVAGAERHRLARPRRRCQLARR